MYLDANVFIYASNDAGEKGKKARKLIKGFEDGELSGAISCLVLDEVAWALQRMRGKDFAVKAWKEIMQISNLKILAVDEAVAFRVPALMEKGLNPRDAVHAAIMLENAITTIVSSDKDFDAIKAIQRKEIRDVA